MTPEGNRLFGPVDPAVDAGYESPPRRVAFFTDTSVCIGCKACEVACKEWNLVPDDGLELLGMSYDNTGMLGADSWRHVAFIEQDRPAGHHDPGLEGTPAGPSGSSVVAGLVSEAIAAADAGDLGTDTGSVDVAGVAKGVPLPVLPAAAGNGRADLRWLMMSDVCKHCTHAACLDVCPTGSLFRTEFGTVVVQEDICNGCGYCIPACPYGVIDQRKSDGRAWKCTLCYDRLKDGMQPACAQACPTDSIQFGTLEELRERGEARVEELHDAGVTSARLYGEDPGDGVGGAGCFFLLLDDPEVYGLPPDPVVATRELPEMWRRAGVAALALAAAAVGAFSGARR